MNGTITKKPLSNGRFSWGYVFDGGRDRSGKRIQVTKSGFETKAKASDALRNAIADYALKSSQSLLSKQTFTVFIEHWLREHAVRRCTPKTLERYRELARYATSRLGRIPLDELSPMQLEQTFNLLKDTGGRPNKTHPEGRPLSARTVRHVAFTVHGALQTAVRWGILKVNPMDRVELPRSEKKEPKFLDRNGIDNLLNAAAGTRLFPLLMLAAATGCRRGELLALSWDDPDFDSGVVNISKSLEETKNGLRIKTTKSGKPRRFAVPQKAFDSLKQHRAEQDHDHAMFGRDYQNNGLVFCRPDGAYQKPHHISVRVRELATKAGLKGIGLHSLRHSHASELLSRGTPIPTVSKRLGHANPNITLSIYSHALEADELAAAKIWDDAMVDVISANKKCAPKRMLENVSAEPSLKIVND